MNTKRLEIELRDLKKDTTNAMDRIGKIVTGLSHEGKEEAHNVLQKIYKELSNEITSIKGRVDDVTDMAVKNITKMDSHVKDNIYLYLGAAILAGVFLGRRSN